MWILELKGLTLKWPLGVDSNYFYTGRLHPKVKTLSLSYTIFDRKGIPFLYIYIPLLENGTPFTYLSLYLIFYMKNPFNKLFGRSF